MQFFVCLLLFAYAYTYMHILLVFAWGKQTDNSSSRVKSKRKLTYVHTYVYSHEGEQNPNKKTKEKFKKLFREMRKLLWFTFAPWLRCFFILLLCRPHRLRLARPSPTFKCHQLCATFSYLSFALSFETGALRSSLTNFRECLVDFPLPLLVRNLIFMFAIQHVG